MAIIQRCKNRQQSVLNESCCGFQESWPGMCLTSCLGISCKNYQGCASGEHCSGWYYKVCSRRYIVQACTQMAIAPLDSTVVTAGNAQLRQATREWEVKVKVKMKLIGES